MFDEYIQYSSNICFTLSNMFSCLTKYGNFMQTPYYFQNTRLFHSKFLIVQEHFTVCLNAQVSKRHVIGNINIMDYTLGLCNF
jgi:hypothetical protein